MCMTMSTSKAVYSLSSPRAFFVESRMLCPMGYSLERLLRVGRLSIRKVCRLRILRVGELVSQVSNERLELAHLRLNVAHVSLNVAKRVVRLVLVLLFVRVPQESTKLLLQNLTKLGLIHAELLLLWLWRNRNMTIDHSLSHGNDGVDLTLPSQARTGLTSY